MANNHDQQARRFIRFRPDPMDYAEIDYGPLDKPFSAGIVALIVEESPMGGCGLILLSSEHAVPGRICRIKLGRLSPLKAEIRWRREVQPDVIRIGVKFLE